MLCILTAVALLFSTSTTAAESDTLVEKEHYVNLSESNETVRIAENNETNYETVIATQTKDEVTCLDCNSFILDENKHFDDFALIETNNRKPIFHTNMKRSVDQIYIFPEILVVVDYALFKKLDQSETKTKDYVTTFMSAVNQRFKTISNPRIELKLAGVQIGRQATDTPYLSSNIVSGDKFEAQAALEDLGRHFYGKEFPDIVFDIVLVLTGQNMCRLQGRQCNPSTAGYAYVGGACVSNSNTRKVNSVGIVEDCGGYSGVVVAAHEIGHLLGASHDGESSPSYVGGPGAKHCSWNDGYIMSDLRRTERGLRWSKCSEEQMLHYVSLSSASCLYNMPNKETFVLHELSALASKVPSLDEQCRQEFGTRSCFSDSRVCTQLFCLDAKTGSCTSYRPAVEGSKCDTDGICYSGQCTKSILVRINNYVPLNTIPYTSVKPSLPSPVKPIKNYKKLILTSSPVNNAVIQPDPKVDSCQDHEGQVGKGLTCSQLYQRFSFLYCQNSRLKGKCCASHQKYC